MRRLRSNELIHREGLRASSAFLNANSYPKTMPEAQPTASTVYPHVPITYTATKATHPAEQRTRSRGRRSKRHPVKLHPGDPQCVPVDLVRGVAHLPTTKPLPIAPRQAVRKAMRTDLAVVAEYAPAPRRVENEVLLRHDALDPVEAQADTVLQNHACVVGRLPGPGRRVQQLLNDLLQCAEGQRILDVVVGCAEVLVWLALVVDRAWEGGHGRGWRRSWVVSVGIECISRGLQTWFWASEVGGRRLGARWRRGRDTALRA